MAGSAEIIAEEMRKARRRPPDNLTAYDHYLLANDGRRLFTRESVYEGIKHATTALALDPNLGRAYVARAWLNYITVHYGAEPDAAISAMESDSRRAVALDPYDAEARAALAFCLSTRGQFKEAEAQLNLSLQANPTNAQILVNATQVLASAGQPERAAEFADKVLRLDPWMTPENLNAIKDAYFFLVALRMSLLWSHEYPKKHAVEGVAFC
jgi:tetratricopeptide (TPR) repeat protein